jgi:hypothetical protein
MRKNIFDIYINEFTYKYENNKNMICPWKIFLYTITYITLMLIEI